jgi:hypothetical protein
MRCIRSHSELQPHEMTAEFSFHSLTCLISLGLLSQTCIWFFSYPWHWNDPDPGMTRSPPMISTDQNVHPMLRSSVVKHMVHEHTTIARVLLIDLDQTREPLENDAMDETTMAFEQNILLPFHLCSSPDSTPDTPPYGRGPLEQHCRLHLHHMGRSPDSKFH